MASYGKLYLLPVPISEQPAPGFLPDHNFNVVQSLRDFIAEDARTARRFLKWFGYGDLEKAAISLLNEHSRAGDVSSLLKPLLEGRDTGLMSDAGCPGIADPGAEVVRLAHQKGITVIPLVGPSSIVLSIMASGFNGQNFAFNGYLPVEKPQRSKRVKELEQLALKHGQAQFFIETPYRNEQLFDALLATLSPQTSVFIGIHLTAPGQLLHTKTVAEWKRAARPAMHKIPVVFGIYR